MRIEIHLTAAAKVLFRNDSRLCMWMIDDDEVAALRQAFLMRTVYRAILLEVSCVKRCWTLRSIVTVWRAEGVAPSPLLELDRLRDPAQE